MGRKGNWFSTVKKALSPESKEGNNQKSSRSKKKWFGKQKLQTSDSYSETDNAPPLPPPPEEIILTHVESENSRDNVDVAIAVDAEEPVHAVQTAASEVQASTVVQFECKIKDEVAAIRIQKSFRAYLARRALRASRGLVRLKSLMEGPAVKRQAISTLRSMQTFAYLQSQIRLRRLRMLEENQALQKQLLQKHTKELECIRIGEEWDDSIQSKEQIEAKLLSKYEAAMRRERAMAYSFSHQQNWKIASRSTNPMFMDPTNPAWGWSWLERWMAARPLENHSPMEKDKNDHLSLRSSSCGLTSAEISKSFARFQVNSEKHSPSASQNPGSPISESQSYSNPPKPASTTKKLKKKVSPKDGLFMDDDTKSIASVQLNRLRRHSIAESIVRDDDSLASSPSVPSYMVPTQSAKAKSRMQSPLATENGTPEKGSFGTAKKRLSFPASPARPRRHSGPSKVESSFDAEITVGNGVAG